MLGIDLRGCRGAGAGGGLWAIGFSAGDAGNAMSRKGNLSSADAVQTDGVSIGGCRCEPAPNRTHRTSGRP